ncbi:MAG: energy-coupling factor transporter transmembrane component T family protein [Candidatus Bathyarchaeia archaeon]
MSIVSYIMGESPIHRMDPRAKIVLCGTIISISFIHVHPYLLAGLLALMVILSFIGRIGRELLSRLKILGSVVAMSFILWTLFYRWSLFYTPRESDILYRLGPITIDRLGLIYGVSMPLRVLIMIGTPLIFIFTTPVSHFIRAMTKLGIPYNVAFGIGLAFRLIPSLSNEWRNIKEAQLSRGLELERGWLLQRIRNHIPIIIPLTIKALEIADQLAIAMETRAFGAYKRRTYYKEPVLKGSDMLVIAASTAALIGSIIIKIMG